MLEYILLIPLFSALTGYFLKNYIEKNVAMFFIILGPFFSFLIGLKNFYSVCILNNTMWVEYGLWFKTSFLEVRWGLLFDSLSLTMCMTVCFISFLVHLYSFTYMALDPKNVKFIAYLSFFTFFMLVLITANNFIQLFLGWEGVGLFSYLLISFWTTRLQAVKSALKAIIINRVGDLGLLVAISLIYIYFKSVSFSVIFPLVPMVNNSGKFIKFLNYEFYPISIICFFLFVGAMAKSAQLLLHTWLPDAMEGPTPVSALIHAATMVTAGVFLILRCSFLFEYSKDMLTFISVLGVLTSFFGATTALFQNDFKKIIAYSTCSQLGYMVTACGMSNYTGSFFHLVSHAFFKALLFLISGVVIHGFLNEQDIRKMGGLLKFFPIAYIMFTVASLSLMGFPFLSGFYSKDLILEVNLSDYGFLGFFCYILGCLSSFFTLGYSCRLIYLVFFTEPNSYKNVMNKNQEMCINLLIPLIPLFIGTLFFGYLAKDLFIGLGSSYLENSIFIHPHNSLLNDFEFMPFYYKLIPLVVMIFGLTIAFFIFMSRYKININIFFSQFFVILYTFFNKKYYFDYILNTFFFKAFFISLVSKIFKIVDKGFLEYFGPLGFIIKIRQAFSFIQKVENSQVPVFLQMFITLLVFILIYI